MEKSSALLPLEENSVALLLANVASILWGNVKFTIYLAYYWSRKSGLFLELIFNPTGKGFFSIGKQAQPVDYFEGTVCRVKPSFFEQFPKKKRAPKESEIVEKLGKVHGIWNLFIKYEDEILIDFDREFPTTMEYDTNPLPSDSNWREDIEYRKLRETSRAQLEKERLEVLQRNDRKLREKSKKTK